MISCSAPDIYLLDWLYHGAFVKLIFEFRAPLILNKTRYISSNTIIAFSTVKKNRMQTLLDIQEILQSVGSN